MKKDDLYDIIIIGGGAAGLTAAIAAARKAAREEQPLRVLLLERLDRVGKKLLATGNGRCNFTNLHATVENYHGRDRDFCVPALMQFHPLANVHFFRELGVQGRVEEEGKVFPFSGQASAVLDALRLEAAHRGVEIVTNCRVESVDKRGDCFLVKAERVTYSGRRLIVATGGMASPDLGGSGSGYKLLSALGHTLVPLYPSLVQIKTENTLPRALKGIKFKGVVTLLDGETVIGSESGEVLFAEYGLSGPPVLQLSHFLGENAYGEIAVQLDFLPEFSADKLTDLLLERRALLGHLTLEYYQAGLVNKKLGQLLLKQTLQDSLGRLCGSLRDEEVRRCAAVLKGCRLPVEGTLGWKHAQVTAGGVDTRDFEAETMESRRMPGLYCAGELLDVDGDCGGFNLQWAWASGRLAGESAVRSLREKKK